MALKQRAALRLEQRVIRVGPRRVDVAVGRHDVVVAGEYDRDFFRVKRLRMTHEAFHPGKLVCEFRAGLRIAIGSVKRGDEHAADSGLDVAGFAVARRAGKSRACNDGFAVAAEDGDAVP